MSAPGDDYTALLTLGFDAASSRSTAISLDRDAATAVGSMSTPMNSSCLSAAAVSDDA
jgi:hypothetical protein